jgi:hypothetical protein
MATDGGGSGEALSRGIVEQAREIAHDIHDEFFAQEPLALLADMSHADDIVSGLDGLAGDIIGCMAHRLSIRAKFSVTSSRICTA